MLVLSGMSDEARVVDCYIHALSRPLQEAYLQVNGFSRGMILFAIPSYGVLFKCRAGGDLLDLEFGAFFALLRFVKTSLVGERIKTIRVNSSNPSFVFTLVNRGPLIAARPGRRKMLEDYLSGFHIEVRLIPRPRNQAQLSPTDLPSIPREQTSPLRPRASRGFRGYFRPIQKGLMILASGSEPPSISLDKSKSCGSLSLLSL
ncbi:MAG: hypothetical protein NTW07_01715 [candidate division Zixibacteria bacterium]|nr:hypothetical protein [candidate division Zixibacteria bacterium]